MNKWEILKDYVTSRKKDLDRAPGGTTSITNFAKEVELRLILQEMLRIEVESDQDRKFQEQVRMENESLSDAADDEWNRTGNGFYYSGVPDFDRKAYSKILEATKTKSVK